MTTKEALLVLGVDSSQKTEDFEEFYQEAVFEQASFFMRRVFIPKLARARIKKLEAIIDAATALGIDVFDEELNLQVELTDAKSYPELIESFNFFETKVKLHLSNAVNAFVAIKAYEKWIQLFEKYTLLFFSQYDGVVETVPTKLTEAPIFIDFKLASEGERKKLLRSILD